MTESSPAPCTPPYLSTSAELLLSPLPPVPSRPAAPHRPPHTTGTRPWPPLSARLSTAGCLVRRRRGRWDFLYK